MRIQHATGWVLVVSFALVVDWAHARDTGNVPGGKGAGLEVVDERVSKTVDLTVEEIQENPALLEPLVDIVFLEDKVEAAGLLFQVIKSAKAHIVAYSVSRLLQIPKAEGEWDKHRVGVERRVESDDPLIADACAMLACRYGSELGRAQVKRRFGATPGEFDAYLESGSRSIIISAEDFEKWLKKKRAGLGR